MRPMPDPEIERALRELVGAFAGPDALPAGGAAGITAIAMGVALGAKVIRLSPDAPDELREVATRLDALRDELVPEFGTDCAAFEALLAALRRPREDGDRGAVIRSAWLAATEAPVRVACLAREADTLLERCRGRTNPNLAGDLAAARELVLAGGRIAAANARENAQHLDAGDAEHLLSRLTHGARERG